MATCASQQYGLITRRQLIGAGLDSTWIRRRVERGALITVHRGVYRVGHRAPSPQADALGAVLACGDGSLLRGFSAGHLFELLRHAPTRPQVWARTARRVAGVDSRRYRALDPRDATRWLGIPTTTVARTLVDLAAELDVELLARACHEAGVRYRTTPRQVAEVLARRPNSLGATTLRAIMSGEVAVSLSALEQRFLELLRQNGLPLPVTNRPAGGHRIDCRWPGLSVELDSYRFHNSRRAWEQDRARERAAYARGDQHRRYTWGDVFERPEPMLGELRVLLSTGNPT